MSYPHYGGHGHWQPQHGQPPPPQYPPHHSQPPPPHPHHHQHQHYAPPPQHHQHYAAPQQPYQHHPQPQPQYNQYNRAPPPPHGHGQPQYQNAPAPGVYGQAPPPTHAHAHAPPAPAPVPAPGYSHPHGHGGPPPPQQYYHQTYPPAAPTPTGARGGYGNSLPGRMGSESGGGVGMNDATPQAQPQVAARGIPSGSDTGRSRRVDTTLARLDVHARRAFTNADKDKNGYITFREFLTSLRDLDAHVPYHDALDTFSKLDTDGDGRIVETEFVNAYLSRNGSFS